MKILSTKLIEAFGGRDQFLGEKVWLFDGKIRATNGHVAIELPQNLGIGGRYKVNKNAPDFENIYKRVRKQKREQLPLKMEYLNRVTAEAIESVHLCAKFLDIKIADQYLKLIRKTIKAFGSKGWQVDIMEDRTDFDRTPVIFLKEDVKIMVMGIK